jgi:hypothetical protein
MDVPAIAGADVAVIVSDGQPSSEQIFHKPCTQLGTEDVTGLAPRLETALGSGRGVWLILERLAFDGTFYLNCHTPTPAISAAVHDRHGSCKSHGECSYRYAGERSVLVIVTASPETIDSGAKYIEAYTARRPRAVAIRLHGTPADQWTALPPALAIVGARSPSSTSVGGTAGAWHAGVQCPTRASGVRVCVRARPPGRDRARPLVGLSPARVALAPARQRDLYELPASSTFDYRQLPAMQAWNYDRCDRVWDRYRALIQEAGAALPPSCVAGGDDLATEVALACGCLGGEARRETIQISQVIAIDREIARTVAGHYASSDNWFNEPDRVNGLAELVQRIATFWSGKLDKEATVVGSLQLTVSPAR